MATHSVGKIFVELDLDPSRYVRAQQTMVKEAKTGAKILERNFSNLGIKSGATFDLMRNQAIQSFEAIKRSGKATTDDLIRAEQAKANKIIQINEQQYGKQISMFSKLKANWLATTVAMTAAYMAIQKAWGAAEMATQYQQSTMAFRTMVQSMGKDADVEFAKIREKSAGLIDQKSLVESANKAISLGIPIEKLGALMEIARVKARDMGISTNQAFNDIATGVGRASPLILDNLGLVMKVGSANEAMAASLGKTVAELTDKEKKMAVLNATLEAGKEALTRYDLSVKTTKEKMDSLKATVSDLNLMIGQVFIRAAAAAVGAWYSLNAASMTFSAGIWKLIQAKNELMAIMTWGDWSEGFKKAAGTARQNAESDYKAALKYTDLANDSFSAMIATTKELAEAGAKVTIATKDNTEALGDNAKAMEITKEETDHLAEALKNLEEKYKKFNEQYEKSALAEKENLFRQMRIAQEGYHDAALADMADFQQKEMDAHRKYIDWEVKNIIDAYRKEEAEAEKSAKVVEELWIKGLNRVQAAFADTFYDAMTGNLDNLGDLFKSFFNDVLRMIAEFAAKMTMYDLFGVGKGSGGSGWGSLLSTSGGGGGGGGFSLFDLLSVGKSGYELASGKSLIGSLYTSLFSEGGVFGGEATLATGGQIVTGPGMFAGMGAAGITSGAMGSTLASGFGGAYGGAAGMGAGSAGGALGAGGSSVAVGGLYAAAMIAAIMIITAIIENNTKGDTRLFTQTQLKTSQDPNRLFTGEMNKIFVSGGAWDEADIAVSAQRVAGLIADTMDMYNVMFENLSETSKEALKIVIDTLEVDKMRLTFAQEAAEGANIWGSIERSTVNEISAQEWAKIQGQLATRWISEFTQMPELTEGMKAGIISAIEEGGSLTGEALADIMGISYQELTNAFSNAWVDELQNFLDSINAAYVGGWDLLTNLANNTIPQAFQQVFGEYFKEYIEEALTGIKGKDVFGFMTDEIQAAIEGLDLDLFLSDIQGFT
ncbi:MAG: hypothetical protein KKE05_00155, partial [Nanoarchaeota archaeon]|nr:hypothetical protein [Nanoarchaeota archaeon]